MDPFWFISSYGSLLVYIPSGLYNKKTSKILKKGIDKKASLWYTIGVVENTK
jgi:hypothetical protein